MAKDWALILNYLNEKRGFDFSGYRTAMVARRIGERMTSIKVESPTDYLHYLHESADELDNLLDVLTINVSRFFRDTLTFEYLADRVLPAIVYEKKKADDNSSIRAWSAGCAMGQEPYSIAILIHELLEKEVMQTNVNIFATDIDGKILKKAQKAAYPFESIKSVKYRLLKKYFTAEEEIFQLMPAIRNIVSFSVYDILDKKSYAPPESVFGGFDLVLCRNVLIYFDAEHQDQIFGRLYRSLAKNGYLVLGEAEIPSINYQGRFRKVNECCHIYQKR
ncbi:MAG: protein-glutamate O-methyltransferase CheR [Desulfamplus sp.]|nr:protein-glutamate O-methyltransferase CheR [Desulfamplus sp.]